MRFPALIVWAAAAAVAAAQPADNKFGIMTHLTTPSWDVAGAQRHLRLASRVAGEWGWVRQYMKADPSEAATAARFIVLCRAMKLRPVLYLNDIASPHLDRVEGKGVRPHADADGGYAATAGAVAAWAAAVRANGVEIPWLEMWNEPNLREGWAGAPDPAQYARYHVAVAKAVHAVSPGTKFLNAAMSNSGGTDDNRDGSQGRIGDENMDSLHFLEEMLNAVPDISNHIDLWASHPYPLNHPPDYLQDQYSVAGYRWETDLYRRLTGKSPPVVITETGYRLGDQSDSRFPKITEDWRVAWTVRAYHEVWLKDPNLIAVCPFLLADHLYGATDPTWQPYAWSNPDFTPKAVLEAVAGIPRPAGRDWLTTGPCRLEGLVRCLYRDGVVTGALVWLSPGGYSAISDESGRFTVESVPAGNYELRVVASGFAPLARRVSLPVQSAGAVELRMDDVGLLANGSMDTPWRTLNADGQVTATGSVRHDERHGGPQGKWLLDGDGHVSVDDRLGSMVLKGRIAIYDDTDYLSVVPGTAYTVSAFFKTAWRKGKDSGPLARITLRLVPFRAHDPNPADRPVEASVVTQSNEDQWIATTIRPEDLATQRLRVVLEVDSPVCEVMVDEVRVIAAAGADMPSTTSLNDERR